MPLRPIDAIFVHPERRSYVVYYRGALWQLPRMKMDYAAWQHRQPYTGNTHALYLSSRQIIHDPLLSKQLRTLDLPMAIRGSTLPRFEAWWETHGYDWLKEKIATGQSPLAAHQSTAATLTDNTQRDISHQIELIPNSNAAQPNRKSKNGKDSTKLIPKNSQRITPSSATSQTTTDIFGDMLAELVDEVLHCRA